MKIPCTRVPGQKSWTSFGKLPFDPTEFPDTESYIWQLRSNFIRMTDQDCPLPDRGVEAQAQTMIMALAKIGALEVLDHS